MSLDQIINEMFDMVRSRKFTNEELVEYLPLHLTQMHIAVHKIHDVQSYFEIYCADTWNKTKAPYNVA